MNKQSCKNCTYWRTDEEARGTDAIILRRCGRIPMWWEATEWVDLNDDPCVEFDRRLKPEFSDLHAFVQDGSDYWARATLLTDAEFGCMHFENAEND